MSRNIGWSKKFAEAMAGTFNKTSKTAEAYVQMEDHWTYGKLDKHHTHQWIVVLQERKHE